MTTKIRISFFTPSISILKETILLVKENNKNFFEKEIKPFLDKNDKDFVKLIQDKEGNNLGIFNKKTKKWILFNKIHLLGYDLNNLKNIITNKINKFYS